MMNNEKGVNAFFYKKKSKELVVGYGTSHVNLYLVDGSNIITIRYMSYAHNE